MSEIVRSDTYGADARARHGGVELAGLFEGLPQSHSHSHALTVVQMYLHLFGAIGALLYDCVYIQQVRGYWVVGCRTVVADCTVHCARIIVIILSLSLSSLP